MLGKDVDGVRAGRLVGLGLGDARTEVAQDAHASFANDLLGDLVHVGQHAADAARRVLVRQRTVRDSEMAFLDEAVTLQLQLEILDPGGGATVEGSVDQRLEQIPDLRPAVACRDAHGARMFGAEDGRVGVVVDHDVLGPPPQQRGKAVREYYRHHGAQYRAPLGGIAERRGRPVDTSRQPATFGVIGNEVEAVGVRRLHEIRLGVQLDPWDGQQRRIVGRTGALTP